MPIKRIFTYICANFLSDLHNSYDLVIAFIIGQYISKGINFTFNINN
jgi:hypothetical protein